jgi:predicted transcriptional regulator
LLFASEHFDLMMPSLLFRALIFAITIVIVVEDTQYLWKTDAIRMVLGSAKMEDVFCAECQEDGESKSEKEEGNKEELKKKDENRNTASDALLTFHAIRVKNVLRHASPLFSDVAPELETPPPEV